MSEPINSGISNAEYCWNRIGLFGDSSCPRLAEVIHCQNCPAYVEGGRGLLDRAPPPDYLDEWTRLLAQAKDAAPVDDFSVLVFRAGGEWMALNTLLFERIASLRAVHRIPHRTGRVLRGLVNIDGELLLCASLEGLMGLDAVNPPAEPSPRSRMIVAARRSERWVFPVEEVLALHSASLARITKPPATVTQSALSFAKGIFEVQGHAVALLDEAALFDGLQKSMNT